MHHLQILVMSTCAQLHRPTTGTLTLAEQIIEKIKSLIINKETQDTCTSKYTYIDCKCCNCLHLYYCLNNNYYSSRYSTQTCTISKIIGNGYVWSFFSGMLIGFLIK